MITTADRLLKFLREAADEAGFVEGITKAAAAQAVRGTLAAVDNALSTLVVQGRAIRPERRAATGMLPRVRLVDPAAEAEAGPVSLAPVRFGKGGRSSNHGVGK